MLRTILYIRLFINTGDITNNKQDRLQLRLYIKNYVHLQNQRRIHVQLKELCHDILSRFLRRAKLLPL